MSFSLGTDTAGSGRVPAGFNNIVGLKPTPGLLSTEGVVPACTSLDCVSVFALSCADADAVLRSRPNRRRRRRSARAFRFGVLRQADAEFFGDDAYAALYAQAVGRLKALGGTAVEIDYAPFRDAAQLLYGGPWVAERTAAVGAFIEAADDTAGIWPVTRQIVWTGRDYSAVDAFEGQYELAELKARAMAEMAGLDFLALPTRRHDLPRRRSRARAGALQLASRPLHQLRELLRPRRAGAAVGFRPDGMPFGITLIGAAHRRARLLAFGARWQRAVPLPLGKTTSQLPPPPPIPCVAEDRVSIAVVGAHMSGLPLNGQLTELGGRLESAGQTAPVYRFYALPGGPPRRPGMVRVADGRRRHRARGLEPARDRGRRFLRKIPAPLGLGTVTLADGSGVPGFLCESHATAGAEDITSLGGWRAYLKTLPV